MLLLCEESTFWLMAADASIRLMTKRENVFFMIDVFIVFIEFIY